MRDAWALVFIGAISSGCAAERRAQPQAADVRLDIVARALTRAEQSYEAALSHEQGTHEAREALEGALSDAQEWLFLAERAVGLWEGGDPRAWARARPCLGENLERVDEALEALNVLPPPGLTQVVMRAPFDACGERLEEARGAPGGRGRK